MQVSRVPPGSENAGVAIKALASAASDGLNKVSQGSASS